MESPTGWFHVTAHPLSNTSSAEGDYDDGGDKLEEAETNIMFHLEVIAFQPTFYDIGNTCTEDEAGVTPITAEVTGGNTDPSKMKENQTACQVKSFTLNL